MNDSFRIWTLLSIDVYKRQEHRLRNKNNVIKTFR